MPKRPRTPAAPPRCCTELSELVATLQRWFESLPEVPRLGSSNAAVLAAARAAVAEPVTSGSATYDESLNGWWRWYADAASTGTRTTAASAESSASLAALCGRVLDAVPDGCASAGELQLARLPATATAMHADDDSTRVIFSLLADLLPGGDRAAARDAAALLHAEVEHDDGEAAPFDFRWIDPQTGELNIEETGQGKAGFVRLVARLCDCARLGTSAVSLSTRVRLGGRLHGACEAVAARHGFRTDCAAASLCPSSHWTCGPPAAQAAVASEADRHVRDARLPSGEDRRFYLILGSPGGLTLSHWDRGVQAVMYHTVAGTNHALAVPRRVALMLQAVVDGVGRKATAWAYALEREVLQACAERRALAAGTFGAGETMLIAPGGGHAVLTGATGKVVVAGEWHLRPPPLPEPGGLPPEAHES